MRKASVLAQSSCRKARLHDITCGLCFSQKAKHFSEVNRYPKTLNLYITMSNKNQKQVRRIHRRNQKIAKGAKFPKHTIKH